MVYERVCLKTTVKACKGNVKVYIHTDDQLVVLYSSVGSAEN